jgi:hypothetical protein
VIKAVLLKGESAVLAAIFAASKCLHVAEFLCNQKKEGGHAVELTAWIVAGHMWHYVEIEDHLSSGHQGVQPSRGLRSWSPNLIANMVHVRFVLVSQQVAVALIKNQWC